MDLHQGGPAGADYPESLQNWIIDEILDRMNTNIYVTDPETDEILFMNKTMKRTFGLEHPEGEVCWKVLQHGKRSRCEFCPVEGLVQGQCRVWEEENTLTGRTYRNYDSLMPWKDGRTVHFQYSMDVTELKRLELAATVDELTGVLSRRAGKEHLAQLLERCREERRTAAVCMFDINDLKGINDAYGHQMGDQVLSAVARAVDEGLGEEDLLFRLSGDEFVAAYPGRDRRAAEAEMVAALERLRARCGRRVPADWSPFCFGALEVEPGREWALPEVLDRVDERLYAQKRLVHIRRAEEKLSRGETGEHTVEGFTYDERLLYDALVKSTDDYLYVCDMHTGTFRYPQAMVEEFDLPGQVVENAAAVWGAKVHEYDRQAFMESNQEITDGRTDAHSVEYRALNRKGEWVWMRCRGHLERNERGEPELFAGFITNLGKRNRYDHLTGLFNKFEFESEVQRLLEGGGPFAVMLFGIDDLKRINSLYDREFGDEAIRIASQKIQSLLPAAGSIFRLDGDEFGVLLREDGDETARSLFCSVQQSFNHQQSFDGKKFFCTLSCGCVLVPRDGEDYQTIVKRAHYALDYAKHWGKNRMEFYSQEALGELERSLELTELLRESIERGFEGFQVHYQPVFDPERRVHGAEALARWSCEKYGQVPPLEFIGLLEKSGLILPTGRWIFRQAVKKCGEFLEEEPQFMMGINLSYLQVEDESFLVFVEETLKEFHVPARHIVLELTESYLAENLERLKGLLVSLRELGICVAMDDFGTGYSSLSLLKQAPVDIVKIDRTFVKGIRESAFNSSFIRLVVELCRILGIQICLEGVETEDEFKITRPMGITYFQGFLLGRPVPADQFEMRFL